LPFKGWKVEALEFFDGLEVENTKAYWTRNKDTYENLVRAPMEELLVELAPQFGEGKIFRPYRDVRFSADKSPYKTNIAAVVRDGYIQLSAEGLGAGSGMWEMAPDQLERYRAAVDADRTGKALEGIAADMESAGYGVHGHGELKTAPKGYPKDHPRVALLRYKGLTAWKSWPPAPWLGTAKAKDRIVAFLEASKPLNTWLKKNVGDSAMPGSRR
jgi:uncharacterized protein (TIGR02453 family)